MLNFALIVLFMWMAEIWMTLSRLETGQLSSVLFKLVIHRWRRFESSSPASDKLMAYRQVIIGRYCLGSPLNWAINASHLQCTDAHIRLELERVWQVC